MSANPCPYRVDGEVGRFEFTTYRVFQGDTLLYDSKECLPFLKGKEWYRTRGFKEIALVYGCTEESYRKTSALINRIRYQEGATPSRTVRDNAHGEGARLGRMIEEKSKKILQAHNFTEEGGFCGCAAEYQQVPELLPEERVNEAIEICQGRLEASGLAVKGHIRDNPVSDEDPTQTVNISDDKVTVKRQKESRKGDRNITVTRQKESRKGKEKIAGQQRKYVHDTVVHVEKGGSSYILTGSGIAQVFQFLIAFLFAGLVALSWWAERFWCRYLCPLGALLGLVSKLSLVRREVRDDCALCARCTHQCPTGTIDPRDSYRSDPAECIVCFDCLTDCTREGIGFRWQLPGWRPAGWRAYDPTRRQALAAVGISVVGVALAGVEPITQRQPTTMIRPPGADLNEFSSLCIRCAACVRVCPTQGLQPSLFEGGVQNLLTPRLVPRLGYCSFSCNACGAV